MQVRTVKAVHGRCAGARVPKKRWMKTEHITGGRGRGPGKEQQKEERRKKNAGRKCHSGAQNHQNMAATGQQPDAVWTRDGGGKKKPEKSRKGHTLPPTRCGTRWRRRWKQLFFRFCTAQRRQQTKHKPKG